MEELALGLVNMGSSSFIRLVNKAAKAESGYECLVKRVEDSWEVKTGKTSRNNALLLFHSPFNSHSHPAIPPSPPTHLGEAHVHIRHEIIPQAFEERILPHLRHSTRRTVLESLGGSQVWFFSREIAFCGVWCCKRSVLLEGVGVEESAQKDPIMDPQLWNVGYPVGNTGLFRSFLGIWYPSTKCKHVFASSWWLSPSSDMNFAQR